MFKILEKFCARVLLGGFLCLHCSLFSEPTYSNMNCSRKATIPKSQCHRAKSLLIAAQKAFPNDAGAITKLFSSVLGYTLLGEKPVSFEEAVSDQKTIEIMKTVFQNCNDFVLKVTPFRTRKNKIKNEICLIHKRSFFLLCEKERVLVDFLNRRRQSPREFLAEITISNLSFEESCNHNPIIVGTLLGFGSQNAALWFRWSRLGYFLGAWPFKHPAPYPSPWIIPSTLLPHVRIPEALIEPKKNEEFKTLYEEWIWLNSHKKGFDASLPPSRLLLPAFFYWEGHEEQTRRFVEVWNCLGDLLFDKEGCMADRRLRFCGGLQG